MDSLYELDECCYQQIVFCFRLCLLLQTKCRLYFLSSSNRWADISKPVATVNSSSDEQMMSACLSLLWATIAMDVFSQSLLSNHYNDALVATDGMPMTTIIYDPCYSALSSDSSCLSQFHILILFKLLKKIPAEVAPILVPSYLQWALHTESTNLSMHFFCP
jgi:hypothetical protein